MQRNTAGQTITLYAFTPADGLPATGDSANITFYVKKDGGAVTALTDTVVSEDHATNSPGMYTADVSQSESNGDYLVFSGKSSTSGVVVVPQPVYTRPAGFSALTIANNRVSANLAAIGNNTSVIANLINVWDTNFLNVWDEAFLRWKVQLVGIEDGAITASAIASNAFTAAKFAAGFLTSSKFFAGAIDSSAIASNAITSAKIATDAITSTQIASSAVSEIQNGLSTLTAAGLYAALQGVYMGGAEDVTIGDTGNDATHLHLPDMSLEDNELNGCIIVVRDSSIGKRYRRRINAWVSATQLATLDAALPFTPEDFTDTYFILSAKDVSGDTTAILEDTGTTIPGQISGLNNLSSAQVQTAATAALTAYDPATAAALATAQGNITDILADTGTTLPAQIAALNNVSTANVATACTTALTTALTEGYRATNATGSVRDLLYEINQGISEFVISSTTKTVKKIDGSTTAKTYTLNDASNPTGITETT